MSAHREAQPQESVGRVGLFDTHCHLDFMSNANEVAAYAAAHGLGIAAVSATPEGYRRSLSIVRAYPQLVPGLGLHPWWVARAARHELESYLKDFDALLPQCSFVGEVGMDASPKHVPHESLPTQKRVLEHIAARCVELSSANKFCSAGKPSLEGKLCSANRLSSTGKPCSKKDRPYVLSLHAVASATMVLDILEATKCAELCTCILHWFSGSVEELWRAVDMGCYLSFGERSLATKRGREYIRIVPESHLLTETDQPPREGSLWPAENITKSLSAAVADIERIRKTPCKHSLFANACKVFGMLQDNVF